MQIFSIERGTYKNYSTEALDNAFQAVKDGMSVHGAAKRYQVPLTTLRDRVDGRVNIDCVSSGPPPLFTQEQESYIVEYIKTMSEIGYGYTRAEVLSLASDYAVDLGVREKGSDLTMKWYYNFMRRWPELHAVKPSGLSELRAKAASPECIWKYFEELEFIIDRHGLRDKPQLIYNVDEKGINTGGSRPPNIVTVKGSAAQVVTSERSQTVTVIGCGNAVGTNIPPFLVFPGKRLLPELFEGATTGCDGAMSDTGYSNTDIFNNYVKNHFSKYVKSGNSEQPILLLYDGHRSHTSLSLIQWASQKNIILFVLPPHTSHLLQPMDVGCFGPFEKIYQQEAHKFMRQSVGRSVTRYDVCRLACKVYDVALSPQNLRSAFRKTGIYPVNPSSISEVKTLPSLVYIGKAEITSSSTNGEGSTTTSGENDSCPAENFFNKRGGEILLAVGKVKQPRRNLSSIIAGRAITEQDVFEKIQAFNDTSKSGQSRKGKSIRKEHSKEKGKEKGKSLEIQRTEIEKTESSTDRAGPSKVLNSDVESVSPVLSDEEVISEEKECCVCGRLEPEQLNFNPYIEFVRWGQCDCGHWIHLSYCVKDRVVRRNTKITCPHCV